MLKIIINEVIPKIMKLFFLAIDPRNEVIIDFSVSLTFISLSIEIILNSEGKRVNVTKKDTTKPNVIIHPKSIIGFIPLKINDKNAQIVVRTV